MVAEVCSWPDQDQILAARSAVGFGAWDVQDARLSPLDQAVGGASGCGDLGLGRRAAQILGDGGPHTHRLTTTECVRENLAPLVEGSDSASAGALVLRPSGGPMGAALTHLDARPLQLHPDR
jgi:hypothetical protein